MMAEAATAELRPFDGRAIPQLLRQQNRWAPWVAQWNEKRQKFDKIPRRADIPEYGLSTADPSRWYTYDAALATFRRESPPLAGIGYVMTGVHGVVGVDLDGCVEDGLIAPWAQEVVDALASYTEVSPSGKGLRVFVAGEAIDWMNHTVGIEVYGGSAPRFLTITGAHLVGTPLEVVAAPDGALDGLRSRYGTTPKATVEAGDMPDLLDELLLPDLAVLDLPYNVRDFLTTGDVGADGDRSRALHSAGVALYQAGLADDEVLSLLAGNNFAMEVALDHRGQDTDRALVYLWREHCAKAAVKARERRTVATAEDFEDVSAPAGEGPAPVAGKRKRFAFERAGDAKPASVAWMIRDVLPQAELAAIFGEPGSGKSFLALDMAMAIARGVEWRGMKVRQGAVGYLVAEGGARFPYRVDAYCDFHGVDKAELDLHLLRDAPNFLEKLDVRDLVAALKDIEGLSLVVVDTLAQVTPGADENTGKDMGRALAHCRAIHRATGAMVLLVAHSGKDANKGIRGWSGIKGALDAEIAVDRDKDVRCATVTKMKDGEGEGQRYPFGLDTVEVAKDEAGESITSCVVKIVAGAAAAKPMPKGDKQRLVLRVLDEQQALAGDVTTSQLLEGVVNQIPFDAVLGKRDTRRQNVLQAIESLVASGYLTTAGGIVNVQ